MCSLLRHAETSVVGDCCDLRNEYIRDKLCETKDKSDNCINILLIYICIYQIVVKCHTGELFTCALEGSVLLVDDFRVHRVRNGVRSSEPLPSFPMNDSHDHKQDYYLYKTSVI